MYDVVEREYFPLLPFEQTFDFSVLIGNNKKSSTDDSSYDQSEPEPETKNEEIVFYNKNNFMIKQNYVESFHKKKSPIKMDEEAANFKFSFYKIFTSRKKFPKKYVVMIHNLICDDLKLPKVTRDETRSIHLYFVNFSNKSEQILMYIQQNKSLIIQNIPELNKIMK